MSAQEKHNEHTRLISLKPHLIGLDGIVLSTAEANIFQKGRLYRQPDGLAFDPSTGTLYNIEYKCNRSESRENHAIDQLHSCNKELKNLFPEYRIINLLVYENFKIEVIK